MRLRRKLKEFMCAAACGVILVGAGAAPTRAVDYRLYPSVKNIAPGQLCTLSVVAVGAGDLLGCVECWVTFDPALVTLVSGREGTLFTNAGVPRAFFNRAIAPDTYSVEGCLLGYQTYAPTPGQVVRYIFRGNATGVSPVRIVRLNLWDDERVLFKPAFDPGAWITVGNPTDVRPRSFGDLDVLIYPNPFNPSVTIELRAPSNGRARVDVYSAAGRLVRRLLNGETHGDVRRFVWDGKDEAGARLPSGVYFASAVSGESRMTRRIVLVE